MKTPITKLAKQTGGLNAFRQFTRTAFLFVASLLLFSSIPIQADEVSDKGKSILEKNKSAVVTIQLVMKGKWEMKGYNQPATEMKQDITGFVIDSTGLTVTALVGTDPGQMYESYYASSGAGEKPKWQSELTDIKILSPDGTEIAAEVVLRDRDLDLAFLRPVKKPETPLPFIDLENAGEVQVLDEVISLNRLGAVSQRVYAASVERISAVVTKPKKFYIPGSEATTTRMGCPAFSLDGKLIGIFVTRMSKGRSGGSATFSAGDNFASILLPAGDIRKVALQAQAHAEKPKDEKKADNAEAEKTPEKK